MPSGTSSMAKQIGEMGRLAGDVKSLLGSQKDVLSRAGLNFPPGVMDGLAGLRDTLERLSPQLASLEAENAQLRALADTSSVINSSLDLSSVLNQVMDTIIRLTSAERGFLMLKDERGELQFRIARNVDRESLDSSAFQVSRTVLSQVAESGEPVVTTNAQADPRFSAQESVVGYNLRSIVCVPLKFKNTITGVIYVDNRIRTGLFTERERDLLAAFRQPGRHRHRKCAPIPGSDRAQEPARQRLRVHCFGRDYHRRGRPDHAVQPVGRDHFGQLGRQTGGPACCWLCRRWTRPPPPCCAG